MIASLALIGAYNATASAEKLVADAEQVQDLGIVIWTSEVAAPPDGQSLDWRDDGGRFKDALGRRLPQVFETNGIPVKGVSMDRAAYSKADPRMQSLPRYTGTSIYCCSAQAFLLIEDPPSK